MGPSLGNSDGCVTENNMWYLHKNNNIEITLLGSNMSHSPGLEGGVE